MTAEEERTRLIGDIARVLRDVPVPEETRAAALTLIGWLARRMPGEPVSVCDLTRCRGRGSRHGLEETSGRGYLDRAGGECASAASGGGRQSRAPRSIR